MKKVLVRVFKQVLKNPSRLKTIADVRPHVFDAFERYLTNKRGLLSQIVCSAMNVSYILLKKDGFTTSESIPSVVPEMNEGRGRLSTL